MFFSIEFDSSNKLNFKRGKNLSNPVLSENPIAIRDALMPKIKEKDDQKRPPRIIKWIFSLEGIKGLKLVDAEKKQYEWVYIIYSKYKGGVINNMGEGENYDFL